MANETFHELIARNKRNSWLLIIIFAMIFVAMGLLIGNYWGHGNWDFSIAVAIGAAVLSFILTLISYYGGSNVLLSMSQAREIFRQDDPQLFNVVEEIAIAAGIPVPRIYMIQDSAMNAFATGRDPKHSAVAITTGLREKLTRDELQGVMAHELSHVRHYDILFATLVAVLVGMIVLLSDMFLRSLWFSGSSRRRSSSDRGGGPIQIILIILALVLAILAPILARIIQMAISRQREYLADAGSVQLTRNPRGLASALAKLSGDEGVLEVANRATAPLYITHPIKKFEERSRGIFETHPPIGERIKRLMSMAD